MDDADLNDGAVNINDDNEKSVSWLRVSLKTAGIIGGGVGCFWGFAFTCLMTFLFRSENVLVVSELTGFAYWLNAAALVAVLVLGGVAGGSALGIAAGKAMEGIRGFGVVVKFAGAAGGFAGVFFLVPVTAFIVGYRVDL